MAIIARQGFNIKKVQEALAIEIPQGQMGDEIRDFNKRLQARSNIFLPVQDWSMIHIATLRTSTTSAVMRCLHFGGVKTPHDHFRTAMRCQTAEMSQQQAYEFITSNKFQTSFILTPPSQLLNVTHYELERPHPNIQAVSSQRQRNGGCAAQMACCPSPKSTVRRGASRCSPLSRGDWSTPSSRQAW